MLNSNTYFLIFVVINLEIIGEKDKNKKYYIYFFKKILKNINKNIWLYTILIPKLYQKYVFISKL